MTNKIKIIALTGPTASGKTSIGVEIARSFNGEIISADSRQVYRGMDIGTGKDISEYSSGGAPVPYHLIDIADPAEDYNLKEFCLDAEDAIKDIHSRGRLPVIAGGSALYLNAFLRGYELPGGPPDEKLREELREMTIGEMLEKLKAESQELYNSIKDKNNRTRIIRAIEKARGLNCAYTPFSDSLEVLMLGVYRHRSEIHKRIEKRLDERLNTGMVEEVEELHKNGLSWERLDYFGLEYRYLALYLQGKMTFQEMRENLFIRIRQFAKSQDVWFRKMERDGRPIYWIKPENKNAFTDTVRKFLKGEALPPPEIQLQNIHYGPLSN